MNNTQIHQNCGKWGKLALLALIFIALAPPSAASPVSLEAWVKADSLQGNQTVMERADSCRIWLNGSYPVAGFFDNSNWIEIQSSSSLSIGKWHHISMSYDQQNLKLYLDGSDVGGRSSTSVMNTTNKTLYVGSNSTSQFFNGSIDEIRFSWLARIPAKDLLNASTVTLNASQELKDGKYWWRVRPLNIDDRSADSEVIYSLWDPWIIFIDSNNETNQTPSEPVTGSDLRCTWSTYFTDAYWANLTWYVDGVQNRTSWMTRCHIGGRCTPSENFTIPQEWTRKGQVWNCSVHMWNSTLGVSRNKSDTATIQNALIKNLTYSVVAGSERGDYASSPEGPALLFTNSSALCSARNLADDDLMDNYTLYYQWYSGGKLVDPSNRLTSTRNISLHLDFDEGEGLTAYDKSGKNNDGILQNGTGWGAGRYGYGARFDGINDYINLSNVISDEGPMSVELWWDSDQDKNYTLMAAPQEPSTQDGGLVLAMDFDGPQDITDGLVLWMRFDNDSIVNEAYTGTENYTVHDYSGLGNHGNTTNNGTGLMYNASGGRFGGGMQFDGKDDYIDLGDRSEFNFGDGSSDDPFTITAWIKMASGAGWFAIFYEGNSTAKQYSFFVDAAANKLSGYIYDDDNDNIHTKADNALSDDVWTSVTVTYDGSGLNSGIDLYKDGVLMSSTDGSAGAYNYMVDESQIAQIGRQWEGNSFANGTIDEVRVYNRTLSPDEINWSAGIEVEDLSWLGNDGNTSGDISYDYYSKFGGAFEFDGVDDYINLTGSEGGSLNITNALTLEVWVKPASLPFSGWGQIAGKYHDPNKIGYAIYTYDAMSYLRMVLGNGTRYELDSPNLVEGQWHHAALTFDGSTSRGYLNGIEFASNLSVTLNSTTLSFVVGYFRATQNDFFNGTIDSVRVYNRSLSAEEIRSHYLGTSLYKFRENVSFHTGTATLHYDVSSLSGFHHLAATWKEEVSSDGQVLFMKFDNDSAVGEAYTGTENYTVYDYSPQRNNGTARTSNGTYAGADISANNIYTSAGKFDGGILLDGKDDFVNLSDVDDVDGLQEITVEAWVYINQLKDWGSVISKISSDNTIRWGMIESGAGGEGNDDVYLVIRDGAVTAIETSSNLLTTGEWHYWVMVYNGAGATDSDKAKFYFDGVEQALTYGAPAIPSALPSTTADLLIGSYGVGGNYFFNGTIDHVMIYNRSLNGSEIQGHYLADYRGGKARLYVDGILRAQDTFAPGGDDFDGELFLGSDERAQLNLSLNGTIDELSVHEQVLSDADVRYNYKATHRGLSRDYIQKGDDVECAIIVDETGPEGGSLISYWGFDEFTGNITYDYTGRNNGTCYNFSAGLCNWTRFGKFRSAIKFDGDDDHIDMGDVLDFTSTTEKFSGEAWIKSNGFSSYDCITCKWDTTGNERQWGFYVVSSKPSILLSDAGTFDLHYQADNTINNNTWYHLAWVVDIENDDFKVYVDGNEVSASHQLGTTTITDISNFGTALRIGAREAGGSGTAVDRFNGTIDSVAIWNRSLSQAEIQHHYEQGIQLLSSKRTIFESRQLDFSSGVAGITYADNHSVWKHDMNWTTESGNLTLGGGYGDSVVLYMNFDRDCTGTAGRCVLDYSQFGNNGTIINATVWNASGKIGGAYEFNGTNQYINVSDPTDGSLDFGVGKDFTVEAWFKVLGGGIGGTSNKLLVDKSSLLSYGNAGDASGYGIAVNHNDGHIVAALDGISDPTSFVSSALSLNTWHHVALVYDNDIGGWLYVNGVMVDTHSGTGGDNSNTYNLTIGGKAGGTRLFNGTIDEVRILNISLSAAEIKRDFLDQNESGVQLSQMDYDAHSNYTSQVFDLGSSPNVTVLRWAEEFPYGDHLEQDENSTAVLILHMDDYVNGTGSVVVDSSGLGNNGTLNGGESMNCTVDGIYGYGCRFDGDNDYIEIRNDTFDGLTTVTFEAWVKFNSLVGKENQQTIISALKSGTAHYFTVMKQSNSGNSLHAYVNAADYANIKANTSIIANRWHHVAVTKDSSTATLYLDGQALGSDTCSGPMDTNLGSTGIGAQDSLPTRELNGTIDEVVIWNRSLSASEIRDHYMRGAANLTLQTRTGSYYENSNPRRILSMHFTPDPTNSSRAEDDSAQGNDGTISGAHFVEGKLGPALRFDGIDDYVSVEVTE